MKKINALFRPASLLSVGIIFALIITVSQHSLADEAIPPTLKTPVYSQVAVELIKSKITAFDGRQEDLIQVANKIESFIKQNDEDPELYILAANTVILLGRQNSDYDPIALRKARELLDYALQIDRDLASAWEALSWFGVISQNQDVCVNALLQLEKLAPETFATLSARYNIEYYFNRDFSASIKLLESWKSNQTRWAETPKKKKVLLIQNLRQAYTKIFDDEAVDQLWQEEFQITLQSPGTAKRYAAYLLGKKDYDEAIKYATFAVESTDDPEAKKTKAKALFWKGQKVLDGKGYDEEAMRLFHQSLLSDLTYIKAAMALGEMQAQGALAHKDDSAIFTEFKAAAIRSFKYILQEQPDNRKASNLLKEISGWQEP